MDGHFGVPIEAKIELEKSGFAGVVEHKLEEAKTYLDTITTQGLTLDSSPSDEVVLMGINSRIAFYESLSELLSADTPCHEVRGFIEAEFDRSKQVTDEIITQIAGSDPDSLDSPFTSDPRLEAQRRVELDNQRELLSLAQFLANEATYPEGEEQLEFEIPAEVFIGDQKMPEDIRRVVAASVGEHMGDYVVQRVRMIGEDGKLDFTDGPKYVIKYRPGPKR